MFIRTDSIKIDIIYFKLIMQVKVSTKIDSDLFSDLKLLRIMKIYNTRGCLLQQTYLYTVT